MIIQDLGVLATVRDLAPSLRVHASTQMTCTDAAAIELASSLGARRIVLPRELSLREIEAIRRATAVELEVFVHGALCIAYSGQCLTSEAIGGRSANRGACAQACRLPYELLVDGVPRDLGDRAYLLSPEDLDASALVGELVAMGIDAVKIEGRLKGALYVAATTELYRRAVDAAVAQAAPPSDAIHQRALAMFSRGSGPGFLAGVDHQRLVEGRSCDHRGLFLGTVTAVNASRGRTLLDVELATSTSLGDGIVVEGGYAGEGEVGGRIWAMWANGASVERASVGTKVSLWLGPGRAALCGHGRPSRSQDSDPVLEKEVATRLEREPYRVPIRARVSGALGELPVFEATTARGTSARVFGDTPLVEARAVPLGIDVVREKLGKLGDTPFVLENVDVDLPTERDAARLVPQSCATRPNGGVDAAIAPDRPRGHAGIPRFVEAFYGPRPSPTARWPLRPVPDARPGASGPGRGRQRRLPRSPRAHGHGRRSSHAARPREPVRRRGAAADPQARRRQNRPLSGRAPARCGTGPKSGRACSTAQGSKR